MAKHSARRTFFYKKEAPSKGKKRKRIEPISVANRRAQGNDIKIIVNEGTWEQREED